jgi:hypothetical protein
MASYLLLFKDQALVTIFNVIMAIGLVFIAISVGPYIFKARGYKINDSKEIKLSDTIGFFLQALIAVVIAPSR